MKLKMNDEIKIREQLTNATYFIMPIFKVPIIKLDEYGFVNTYLYDKNRPDTEPDAKTIYALFRPNEEQLIELQKQIDDWDNNGFLIGDYDYQDGYVVVMLRFPDKYREQYKLFMKGAYSKFSEEYKDEIPKKVSIIKPSDGLPYEGDSLQYLIMNKRVKLKNYWEDQTGIELTKDMEYWSKPTISYETLDIDKVIEERIKKEKEKENEPGSN